MHPRSFILALLLALPVVAQAASSANFDLFDCSDSPALVLLDTASISCQGNLLLSGGAIRSDERIVISATGSLSLLNIELSAPFVELTVQNGLMSLGEGTSIHSGSFMASVSVGSTGGVVLSPGMTLSMGGDTGRILTRDEALTVVGTGGWVSLSPSGDISLMPPVPEPSAIVLMFAGLLLVFGFHKLRVPR